ncbi:MAG TPA: GGDEF domain-containing protein [Burkholderiaceae bacterium]|jgi:diguanylate cyclase (GGDEF)-like protein
MHFDLVTLFNLLLVQALIMALLLIGLQGRHASRASRWTQGFAALQALGWLMLAASSQGSERALLGLSMLAFSASLAALWWAVGLWLTPRPGRVVMAMAVLLMPLVYVLQFDQAAFRVAWAHAWLAMQLLMIAASAGLPQRGSRSAPPPSTESRRWRTLLVMAVLPLAVLFIVRGALGFFGRELDTPFEPSIFNTWLGLMCMLAQTLALLALVLAWRGEIEVDLARLTQVDALTGLQDRESFVQRAVAMISMARRYQEPLSLMVLDIDFLSQINDEHGREIGDRALALFASCLNAQMRLGDLAGRVGGEEFGMLMARSDAQGPQAFDKRMREALSHRAAAELGFPMDFSAGWAPLRHGDRNIGDLMRRAETALYEAKHAGRGQLVSEPGLES